MDRADNLCRYAVRHGYRSIYPSKFNPNWINLISYPHENCFLQILSFFTLFWNFHDIRYAQLRFYYCIELYLNKMVLKYDLE